jgi:Asp-tRNA(Asn)/Glu-tRNA(Gln) amidotransferase A subunit family amidase
MAELLKEFRQEGWQVTEVNWPVSEDAEAVVIISVTKADEKTGCAKYKRVLYELQKRRAVSDGVLWSRLIRLLRPTS